MRLCATPAVVWCRPCPLINLGPKTPTAGPFFLLLVVWLAMLTCARLSGARLVLARYASTAAATGAVRIPNAMSPEELDILLNRQPPSRRPTEAELFVFFLFRCL